MDKLDDLLEKQKKQVARELYRRMAKFSDDGVVLIHTRFAGYMHGDQEYQFGLVIGGEKVEVNVSAHTIAIFVGINGSKKYYPIEHLDTLISERPKKEFDFTKEFRYIIKNLQNKVNNLPRLRCGYRLDGSGQCEKLSSRGFVNFFDGKSGLYFPE